MPCNCHLINQHSHIFCIVLICGGLHFAKKNYKSETSGEPKLNTENKKKSRTFYVLNLLIHISGRARCCNFKFHSQYNANRSLLITFPIVLCN